MTTTMASHLAPRARQYDYYNGSGFWISSAIFTCIFGLFFFIHLGLAIKYKCACVIPLVLFVFFEALAYGLKLATSWIYYGDGDAAGSVFTAWTVIFMSAPFCAFPSPSSPSHCEQTNKHQSSEHSTSYVWRAFMPSSHLTHLFSKVYTCSFQFCLSSTFCRSCHSFSDY